MSISKAVMNAISKMDAASLNQISALINERRAEISYDVKCKLKVGDRVKVNHRKLAGQIGTITDIRRSRVSFRTDNYRSFNVPISLIVPVK